MADTFGGDLSTRVESGARGWRSVCAAGKLTLCAAFLFSLMPAAAPAAIICVNPGGTRGCQSSIATAVGMAAAGDTVSVAPGSYAGGIVIDKPLSLIGQDQRSTIIDASGVDTGILIDGMSTPGLSDVTVAGFTVENANYEGVLVLNASSVTISGNRIVGNDAGLDPATVSCPGLPSFETLEGFDCGEGIHLSGATSSMVIGNLVERNAGGILLSDDTGATHDNLVSGNVARDNPYDCGITLASHPPAPSTGSSSPLGVYHNTISGNDSLDNGRAVEGAGAGVGLFTSIPGAATYDNVVTGNRLLDNGLPGVALHSHAPGQDVDGNVITRNQIAGNGADTEDAATPGPTGINVASASPIAGLVVSQNAIGGEDVDIAVRTPTDVTLQLNQLASRTIGVDNLGLSSVDATKNWWGCPGGPGAAGCSTIAGPSVLFAPWLTKPL